MIGLQNICFWVRFTLHYVYVGAYVSIGWLSGASRLKNELDANVTEENK
jgi:hypothetical protein